VAPEEWADAAKREAALLFKERWDAVRADPAYRERKAAHEARPRPPDCDG
jgi:hypothetical protein